MKGVPVSLWAQTSAPFRVYRNWLSRASRLEFHYQYLNVRGKLTGQAELRYKHWQIQLGDFQKAALLDDYPVKYRSFGAALRAYGSVEDHCRYIFGDYMPLVRQGAVKDTIAAAIYNSARKKTTRARVSQLMYLLTAEFEYALANGWFVVFNTLTVADWSHDIVFSKGSRAWTDYVRRVERASPGATVFGVVEHGSKTGRLHIHCLHFLPSLPSGCVDPNAGLVHATNRVIDGFRRFWSYGHSMPIAVRLATRDSFSALGWRWPADIVDGRILPTDKKHYEAVVAYLIKYVSKSYAQPKEFYQWRTRRTRSLGLRQIESFLSCLKLTEIKVLLKYPALMSSKTRCRSARVPLNLMRRQLCKSFLRRKNLNVRRKLNAIEFRDLKNIMALPLAPTLPERWKIMTRKVLTTRQRNLMNFPSPVTLRIMAAFDYLSADVRTCLDGIFPVVRPLSVRGNY